MEPPVFDDALDEDVSPYGPDGDTSEGAPSGGEGGDEATSGEGTNVTEEPGPYGDDLFAGAVAPDH